MENSIFTVERRMDFEDAYDSFIIDIEHLHVSDMYGSSKRMMSVLEHAIRFWPYRCGATSIEDYLKGIGVNLSDPQNDIELLRILELLINLLHWAPIQYDIEAERESLRLFFDKNNVRIESERLLENVSYILEQCCNMYIREYFDEKNNKDVPQYVISKRDAVVDSTVESVPELSEVLLGYLDIRNADSREYKESALLELYGHMESKREYYKGLTCKPVSEEFFICMNTLGIRHKTKKQIKIHYSKRNKIYDKLFKMALYVLQTETVNQYKNDMKNLRSGS